LVLKRHLGAQLSQPFVVTSAKLGKTSGPIVDGVEKNHSGGHIFTLGISSGQWGPHIISTLKAQQAKLVKKLLFSLWSGQKRKSFVFVLSYTKFGGICYDMSRNVFC